MRLLADDAYFEELELVENELIDQYVRNSLTSDEREKLEQRLLRSAPQQQKLGFARALLLQSDERAAATPKVVKLVPPSVKRPFANTYLRIAAGLILVVGLGVVVWTLWGRTSDVDRGMAALNQAHNKNRLIQSRISALIYAPLRAPRGGNDQGTMDRQARDYSERLLLDAVNQRKDASSYHALGRLYLAERDFGKAREQFEIGLAKAPNDAQLQSDMGAALLELGAASDENARLQYYAESLQHLNRALDLNPSLAEALFNRALLYQNMKLVPQAKEGWRKYLEVDATSPWAGEAKANLKALEDQEKRAYEKRTDLYESFVAAYQAKSRDAGWLAFKQSRSRAGNYIVEKLLDDIVSLRLAGKRQESVSTLEMLSFVSDVERQYANDRYTSDLVTVFRELGDQQYAELAKARELVRSGTGQYDRSEFESSIPLFTEAQKIFEKVGDEPEALFAQSWIGYNELRSTGRNGEQRFELLSHVYAKRNYQSLLAQSLHAWSDALTQRNEFSKILDLTSRALKLAEAIEDDSTRLRCLQQFIWVNRQLGNYKEAFVYATRALEVASGFIIEPKLILTFYHEIAAALSLLNLSDAALEFQQEALRLATEANWPLNIVRSYTQFGIIYQRRGQYDLAIYAGLRAIEEGSKIENENSRLSAISHAHMRLGHIYAEAGDTAHAIENYDQALAMFEQLQLGMFLYEAHKGKFVSYVAAGNPVAAQSELVTSLDLFEQYRDKIREERNRNAFFDAGQNIYDLAIDFTLTKLNEPEKAFDYAETSRARALLDLIHSNPQIVDKGSGLDIELVPGTRPQPFSLFRNAIPPGVTILEYALLNDKLVVWVLKEGRIESEVTPISSTEINQEVLAYIQNLAKDGDVNEGRAQAANLYHVLIHPIEKYLNNEDELCIVPDKVLSNLPFGALFSADNGKYLFERNRVLVAPSANVFVECTESALHRPVPASESVLSVGNPNFSRQQFPNLTDLPSAEREAEFVAATYKSAPLLGSNASESEVRARMVQADVVHFAAHYVIDAKSPLESALLLSQPKQSSGHEDDGLLQAYEIYGLKLPKTRLAVLSACQTAAERSYQGEGAIGMARAFISAGVPVVVASLWPVDSGVTAELMIKFHEYRKTSGVSAAEALHMAQRDMLAMPDEKLRRPYAWAGFVAFGGHTNF